MREQYDVFICYSRRNSRFVNRLVSDLREHHITPWLDTIELEVGQLVHLSIEQAIERSRFFCLIISPAALRSYYVREVEFELGFAKMVREKRESYILPILWQGGKDSLPARIIARHYLNFTNSKNYTENVRKLGKKIHLGSETFSGRRWYKALEISPFGQIVGIGLHAQVAKSGGSVCIIYDHGQVAKAEIFYNGQLVNWKEFTFDKQGRVCENLMYEQADEPGTWRYVDTWRYYYDEETGRRSRKIIDAPGNRSFREMLYDGHNRVMKERVVTRDGPPDMSYGYTTKVFTYTQAGELATETWFDAEGKEISR